MSNSRLLHISIIILAALVLAPWPVRAVLSAGQAAALASGTSPNLAVVPDAGSPLTPVVVSGSGYPPSVAVSIRYGEAAGTAPEVIGAALTGPDGSLPPLRVTIPADAAPGGIGLLAAIVESGSPITNTSGTVAPSAPFAVTPLDRGLIASPGTLAPGGMTTISGSGFQPDTTVQVQVTDASGATAAVATGVPSTPTGAILPVSLTIPLTATAGLGVIDAVDSAGNVAGIPIDILPAGTGTVRGTLYLEPTRAAIGQTVGFTADGLSPHEAVVLTLLDANGVAATFTAGPPLAADGNGHLQGTFPLPTAAGVTGDSSSAGYTLGSGFALGGNEGTLLSVTLQAAIQTAGAPSALAGAPLVIAGTRLQPFPAVTTPGQSYTIIGSGFGAGEQVTVTQTDASGTISQLGMAQASDTGVFGLSVTAPTPSNGASAVGSTYTVTATGEPSGRVASTRVVVHAAPTLTLQPYVAASGQQVVVQGMAFAPYTRVTIQTGLVSVTKQSGGKQSLAQAITLQVSTDGSGAFTASFSVPTSTRAGPVTIQAQDSGGNAATSVLTVSNQPASVRVSPLTALPGQALTVQGHGFGSGELLDLFVADAAKPSDSNTQGNTGPLPLPGSVVTVRADAQGSFAASYPLGASEEHWTAGAAYLFGVTGETSGRHAVTDFVIVSNIQPAATPTPSLSTRCASALNATMAGGETVVYFASASTQQVTVSKHTVVTFEDELEILNTGDQPATVTVAYLPDQTAHPPAAGTRVRMPLARDGLATIRKEVFSVGPHKVVVRSVNGDIGNGHITSIIVRAELGSGAVAGCPLTGASGLAARSAAVRVLLISHRTQSTLGARAGSADRGKLVLGAAATSGSGVYTNGGAGGPSTQWFFAGGYAGGAFQEQLMLFNPQPTPAQVHVHLFWRNGTLPGTQYVNVPAFGRRLVDVQTVVARAFRCGAASRTTTSRAATPCTAHGQLAATGIGLQVDSSMPIVAARTLYWGTGVWAGKEGFDMSSGTPAPLRQQYFAYASTVAGDRAELSILNPNGCTVRATRRPRSQGVPCGAQVTVSAFTGSGARIALTHLTVPAHTRITVLLGKGAPGNRIAVNQGVYALSVQSTLPVVSELAQYVGSSPGNETGQGADPGFDEPGTQGSTALNGGGYVTVSNPLIQVFNPTMGQMAIRMTALSTQGVYFLQNYEVAAGASLTLALPAPPARPAIPRTPVGVSVSCSGPCVGVALTGMHGTAIGTAPVPAEVWDNPLQ